MGKGGVDFIESDTWEVGPDRFMKGQISEVADRIEHCPFNERHAKAPNKPLGIGCLERGDLRTIHPPEVIEERSGRFRVLQQCVAGVIDALDQIPLILINGRVRVFGKPLGNEQIRGEPGGPLAAIILDRDLKERQGGLCHCCDAKPKRQSRGTSPQSVPGIKKPKSHGESVHAFF